MEAEIKDIKNVIFHLSQLEDISHRAIKEVIDEQAARAFVHMRDKTPVGSRPGSMHGGLKMSLKHTKKSTSTTYGYVLDYEGYNREYSHNPRPFSVIARTLNRGTMPNTNHSVIAPRYFIRNAVRMLKQIDKLIEDRFLTKLEDLAKKMP